MDTAGRICAYLGSDPILIANIHKGLNKVKSRYSHLLLIQMSAVLAIVQGVMEICCWPFGNFAIELTLLVLPIM